MKINWNEIETRAVIFSKDWKNAKSEKSEAQLFLNDFFHVFGVDLKKVAMFEKKVPMGKGRDGFIDLLWKGVILIEMKSRGQSLKRAYKQATDYAFNLKDDELPDYMMVCDFEYIRLYRLSTRQEWTFKTANLRNHVRKFAILAGYKSLRDEYMPDMPVNEKAARKMAKLHDKLKENGYEGHNLEVYLVRLMYCMFSDDSGIFERGAFYNYIKESKEDGSDLSERIAKLFEFLDMNDEKREKNKLLPEEMKKQFPYINGRLFSTSLPFAYFDSKMRSLILECCKMDWSKISPAIFGAMFQEVTDQKKRRELGAHYTSEENILKLIKPLFLDDLRAEFERIKYDKKKLSKFHDKLANLKFLDPACGCGNFLIVAYRELRLLELDVLAMQLDDTEIEWAVQQECRANVNQFYGIEIEDFPCQIAQVGMWLIDHQMNRKVADHFGLYFTRLPLKTSATIINENALRIDWNDIVPKEELNYIMGNPPFSGYHLQNSSQKEDMKLVFDKKIKNYGVLDYVASWYKKAADYMKDTKIESAFVSTNSITQGQQPAVLWESLEAEDNTVINFAYRTFKWTNEAKGKKAAVHCVIIGFSDYLNNKKKKIFEAEGRCETVININPYLANAPNILVKRRSYPLCDVPTMNKGSQPTDGGFLLLNKEEKNKIIEENSLAKKWIRPFMGAEEFINNKERWCLWLVDAKPNELRKCKLVMDRIKKVKEFRLNSKKAATRKLANYPMLFGEIRQPNANYILLPVTSSENRKYIPTDFVNKNIIVGNTNQFITGGTLYEFGILTSIVHMTWIKTVAGRLKSDYSYSSSIVYNNFIWPKPTAKQKEKIEQCAQAILDARKLYPDSTLADLYDPNTMPPEISKAHERLDNAVKEAYGKKGFDTEEEIVSSLMDLYKQAIDAENDTRQQRSNII